MQEHKHQVVKIIQLSLAAVALTYDNLSGLFAVNWFAKKRFSTGCVRASGQEETIYEG